MQTLSYTDFNFSNQTYKKSGKVRDIYIINNDLMVAVTTDRISAFDSVLKSTVPFKGQVLNLLSAYFLQETKDIVPNWLVKVPHKNVSIGLYCKPYPVEIIVRQYLSGSSWRNYKDGNRQLGGIHLADGLYENARLPRVVITPSTKNDHGHDVDISKEEIIKNDILSQKEFDRIEEYSLTLFNIGQRIANRNGLILADTKYEFGNRDGKIYLIDEIHTPDSSRYFYKDQLESNEQNNSLYKLSKEYLRKWLIENKLSNDPYKLSNLDLPEDLVLDISNNYVNLYETVTNKNIDKKCKSSLGDLHDIVKKVNSFLHK